MPGSPYLDEPPKGLLTWPILLRLGIPTLVALTLVAIWQDVLVEFMIVLTAVLTLSALMKK